jgi:HlyD family secretion protein
LAGKVERVSLKVGRLDVVGTDPIAKTDARVVEVFILLDDSDAVSRFTNMQVKVEILP